MGRQHAADGRRRERVYLIIFVDGLRVATGPDIRRLTVQPPDALEIAQTSAVQLMRIVVAQPVRGENSLARESRNGPDVQQNRGPREFAAIYFPVSLFAACTGFDSGEPC